MELTIELTYNCLLSCKHCSSIGISASISLDQIKSVLEQYNIAEIILSGGEPTIHPQFNEITDYLIKQYDVSLYTNGINLLPDKTIIKFHQIFVSIYGWEDLHNFITNSYSFRDSLYFLINAGIQMRHHYQKKNMVIVNTPIFNKNTSEVITVARTGNFLLHLIRLLPHGRAQNLKVLTREKQLQIAQRIQAEYPNTIISQSLLHKKCNWQRKLTLLPNGKVIHCVAGKHLIDMNKPYICDEV